MRQVVLIGITGVLVGGCQLFFSSAQNDDAVVRDGGNGDGRPQPLDARQDCSCAGQTLSCPDIPPEVCIDACVMSGSIARCTEFVPSNGATWDDLTGVPEGADGTLMVSGRMTINTDTKKIQPASGGELTVGKWRSGVFSSVLALDGLVVMSGTEVQVVGSLPLILVVRNAVNVQGTIDLSGDATSGTFAPGPGGGKGGLLNSPATGCSPGADGVAPAGGNGGGFGGTAAGVGSSAPAAQACAALLSTKLQGGSGGGYAGDVTRGGGGGGALQISARKQVNISGAILAQGVGGSKGVNTFGGGGGGAGGGILIETLELTVTGQMYANGGGGGAAGFTPANGLPGVAGLESMAVGNGGGGGARTTPPGNGSVVPSSGGTRGGGGGAVGKIEVRALPGSLMLGTSISPEALPKVLIFQ